jgi:N-acetylmuramic acid 6-phosphate etherase
MNNIIPKTELLYKKSKPIDKLNIIDGINLMVDEQKKAATEVKKSTKSINYAINKIFDHLTLYKEGRLIYVGAGTSGRIGIQDGVELYPTFNWPKDRLEYIIAGGTEAILSAVENAEDDILLASDVIKKKTVSFQDVVIGLAASGNTPFTCKVMQEAQQKKALTISISNNPNGKILKFGKVQIVLDTKEEVIAGSTRLKAGTAQKICLNIISSMVMTKMGRVKNGFMNNMVPTNEKLRKRKLSINSLN